MIVSPPPPAGLSGYLRGRRQGSPSLAIKYFLHSDICRIALRNERSWDLTDAALSWNMSSWYCYHKRVHSVQCSQHQEPPGRLEYRCSDQQVQQASAERCHSRWTLVNCSPRGQLGQFPAPHFSWTLPVLFLDQSPSILRWPVCVKAVGVTAEVKLAEKHSEVVFWGQRLIPDWELIRAKTNFNLSTWHICDVKTIKRYIW